MNTILELKNIHKSYKQKILCGLNYKFHDTGLYVIYGVSGSGKSTLLNIIARFDRPNHGEILLRYRNLEYVMQEHMLFTNLSIRENLYIKLNLTDYKVNEYDDVIQKICKTLHIDNLIDEKVSFLSGGEKQRVSLARALLSEPEVILLDEPTASIDHERKMDLLKLLSNLSKKRLILITTHDPLVKEYADEILYLERGKFQ